MPGSVKMAGDTAILIGKKGVMSYVLAVVTQFNQGAGQVTIKARGRAISRAVDVAEVVRSRFVQSAKVKGISIATEELERKSDGNPTKVSSIEIILEK